MTDPTTPARPYVELPKLRVALDGPSSSGKSTVGMEAARRLGYRFCDTGLLYRAVSWLATRRGLPAVESPEVVALADEVVLVPDARGRLRHVQVDGEDVTAQVRTPAVDHYVSEYSRLPQLRAALVARQRAIAADPGIIVAGRDIGTVILPDADIKIYLDASPEERARRRVAQRHHDYAPGESEVLAELRRRDTLDSGRTVAPLRVAPDAIVLQTDGNSFQDTVRQVVGAIRSAAVRSMPPGAGAGAGAGAGTVAGAAGDADADAGAVAGGSNGA